MSNSQFLHILAAVTEANPFRLFPIPVDPRLYMVLENLVKEAAEEKSVDWEIVDGNGTLASAIGSAMNLELLQDLAICNSELLLDLILSFVFTQIF
jgi:hypothetical protein